MKLSIIIPVYNAEKYLYECLSSIMNSVTDEIEVIVINDGSTDGSENVYRNWNINKDNIIYIEKENGGVSEARNKGIEVAKGEYVLFLDADDKLFNNWKELIDKYMMLDNDFIAFSYVSLFENGVIKSDKFLPIDDLRISDNNQILKLLFASPLLHTCWGKLFKRSIIEKYNIRFKKNVPIGEDYLFVLDYMKYSKAPILINEDLIYYRQVATGAMGNFKYLQRKDALINISERCIYDVKKLGKEDLVKEVYYYYFRSFTKLLRDMCIGCKRAESKIYIEDIFKEESLNNIIKNNNDFDMGRMKKIELKIINFKNSDFIYLYFRFKGFLVKWKQLG